MWDYQLVVMKVHIRVTSSSVALQFDVSALFPCFRWSWDLSNFLLSMSHNSWKQQPINLILFCFSVGNCSSWSLGPWLLPSLLFLVGDTSGLPIVLTLKPRARSPRASCLALTLVLFYLLCFLQKPLLFLLHYFPVFSLPCQMLL